MRIKEQETRLILHEHNDDDDDDDDDYDDVPIVYILWDPEPPGTLRACPHSKWDNFTIYVYIYIYIYVYIYILKTNSG